MRPPEEVKKIIVRQWLGKADEDMKASEALLATEPPFLYPACFHAQQCAEKYLKGYLVHRGVDFPYTHNISLLLELCGDLAAWPQALEDAEELTQYAITTRYPGEERSVTPPEARRAVDLASQVRQVVQGALADDGVNL